MHPVEIMEHNHLSVDIPQVVVRNTTNTTNTTNATNTIYTSTGIVEGALDTGTCFMEDTMAHFHSLSEHTHTASSFVFPVEGQMVGALTPAMDCPEFRPPITRDLTQQQGLFAPAASDYLFPGLIDEDLDGNDEEHEMADRVLLSMAGGESRQMTEENDARLVISLLDQFLPFAMEDADSAGEQVALPMIEHGGAVGMTSVDLRHRHSRDLSKKGTVMGTARAKKERRNKKARKKAKKGKKNATTERICKVNSTRTKSSMISLPRPRLSPFGSPAH